MEFTEDGAGLVVKLGRTQSENAERVMKFDCEKFSCFPKERETLFFGGVTELKIKGIDQLARVKWNKYDKYMEPNDAFNRMMAGSPLTGHVILDKLRFQIKMNDIIRDQIQGLLSSSDEIVKKTRIPPYIKKLVSYQISLMNHVQLQWHELMNTYDWMRTVLVMNDEDVDYLNLANISVLFSHADIITLRAVNDEHFSDETKWKSIMSGLRSICEMGCSTKKIQFELSAEIDEVRQDLTYQMALTCAEESKSEWDCAREGNVLIFSVDEKPETTESSAALGKCASAIIRNLRELDIRRRNEYQMNRERAKKKLEELRKKKEKENEAKILPFQCLFGSSLVRCPSARILKGLLKRLHRHQSETSALSTLQNMLNQHNYSATNLLDDFYHILYVHGVDADDNNFDDVFSFFADTLLGGCSAGDCKYLRQHYRDRGSPLLNVDDEPDEFLMDIMTMIHCYFLHSFDLYRLTKEERQRVEMELLDGVALDDEEKGDTESDDIRRTELVADILRAKAEKMPFFRGNRRFCDAEYGQSASETIIGFAEMAETASMDVVALREALSGYGQDRDQLIGDLIDVVYGQDVEELSIWKALNVDDVRKQHVARQILHGYFKCTQLSSLNMNKFCQEIVERHALKIDMTRFEEFVTNKGIDGRIFDARDPEQYKNAMRFVKMFAKFKDFKPQHVRRLYRVMRKWKYVVPIIKTSHWDADIKGDELEPLDDSHEENASDQRPAVHEIGKRFYFWDSHRKHPDYVLPKHNNMKEEVLFTGLISVRAWNTLTKHIAAILTTESALRITSNGFSEYMYHIQQYEPLDAAHLRAFKLYIDYGMLCLNFLDILKGGDPTQISHIVHWARALIETVQCFGTPLNSKEAHYCSVNQRFLFQSNAIKFNLPLSTTPSVKFLYLHLVLAETFPLCC